MQKKYSDRLNSHHLFPVLFETNELRKAPVCKNHRQAVFLYNHILIFHNKGAYLQAYSGFEEAVYLCLAE